MSSRHAADSAVVLVSGGLDSAVTMAVARADGMVCHALSFDYGQRHRVELDAARRVSASLGARSHRVIAVDLRAVGGSALTAPIDVPRNRPGLEPPVGIPVTYVPARNLIFLAIATGVAEVEGAAAIYLGANAVDYSGYPDCRRPFLDAFGRAAALGTKSGVEGRPCDVRSPLVTLTKAEIIRLGTGLGVDFALTTSCYDPDGDGRACGECDSCRIRARGFREAGVPDPTRYAGAVR